MRKIYYTACGLPAGLLLLSTLSPNGWPEGGPKLKFQLALMILIPVCSLILTAVGLFLLALAIADRKEKCGISIATIISALPGLGLMILFNLPK